MSYMNLKYMCVYPYFQARREAAGCRGTLGFSSFKPDASGRL